MCRGFSTVSTMFRSPPPPLLNASAMYRFTFVGQEMRFVLIIVQRDATQSNLFIILQVHSTCFGCQPHPSSAVRKAVTTASGTGQLPHSNVAMLA